MPHQGESASFFSLHFFLILIAIARQVSPPPPLPTSSAPFPSFSPIAGPLPPSHRLESLGRRSFHAGAQTFYFQRKPASEGECPRAGSGAGFRGAGDIIAAPAQTELAWKASSLPAQLPATASSNAPGGRERTQRFSGASPVPGSAAEINRLGQALSSPGPSESAESGRAEGAGAQRRPHAARSPSGFVPPSARAPKSLLASRRLGAPCTPPALADSAGQAAPRPPETERQRERVRSSREKATRPRRWNGTRAPKQLRAERVNCQLPGSPPDSGPQLERRARNLKTLRSRGSFSPTFAPALQKLRSSSPPVLRPPVLGGYFFFLFFSFLISDKAAFDPGISTSFEVKKWIAF